MTSPLANQTLSACYLTLPPYIQSTPPTGIAIKYLDHLQSRLNFSTILTHWNSTADSLLQALTSTSPPCHLAVAPFAITESRMRTNTFLWSFASESYRMVQSKAALTPPSTPWLVFHTFSPRVWFFLLLGIFLHAIGTIAFTNAPSQPSHRRAIHTSLIHLPTAVLRAYAHFIGNPLIQVMRTPSFQRAAWLLLGVTSGIFLLTVYESSLTVLLFESVRQSQFATMDDIKRCVIDPTKVAMIVGGASQQFWNFAVNTSETRDTCAWSTAGVVLPSFERAFQSLIDGDVDYFFDLEGAVVVKANDECDKFMVVGEPFFSTQVGFAVSGSVSKAAVRAMSRETRLLREADVFPTAKVLATQKGCDARIAAKVKVSSLSGFFGLYGGLWALLLGYRCVVLMKKRTEAVQREGGLREADARNTAG